VSARGQAAALGGIGTGLTALAAVCLARGRRRTAALVAAADAALITQVALCVHTSRRGKFEVWARILHGLSLRGDETLLDMGCGRGAVLLTAAKLLPAGRAIGVDLWRADPTGNSPQQTLANAAAENVADRVEVRTADITDLPFDDDSVDVIVSSLAIHKIPSPEGRARAVREAARVLRPGGKLAIADLWATRRHAKLLRELGWQVRRCNLGWRTWWGGPWGPTHLLTATKPTAGKHETAVSFRLPALTPAQESLFLTQGGRALDSRLPRPFLGDTMADEIITRIGYDLSKFPTISTTRVDPRVKVFEIAVRAKRLDEVVRRFVLRHPDAVVLDLGAGLDGRVFRVEPPPTVDWYDVDFPQVIALRSQVLPKLANVRSIGADVAEPNWLDELPADRPAVIVADGLGAFLTSHDFVVLLNRLIDHFPSGELAFNAYTTYAIWLLKHSRAMAAIAGDVVNPGFNDPRLPEGWVDGLELVEEMFLSRAPEVVKLPRTWRFASRLAARSPVSRMIGTVVLRYRF
jgi:O-methyltransferase involved in polyketide biosynthesis/precorrin-6B methylase 2